MHLFSSRLLWTVLFILIGASETRADRFFELPPAVEEALILPMEEAAQKSRERLLGNHATYAQVQRWIAVAQKQGQRDAMQAKFDRLESRLVAMGLERVVVPSDDASVLNAHWDEYLAEALESVTTSREHEADCERDLLAARESDFDDRHEARALKYAREQLETTKLRYLQLRVSRAMAVLERRIQRTERSIDRSDRRAPRPPAGSDLAALVEQVVALARAQEGQIEETRQRLLTELNALPKLSTAELRSRLSRAMRFVNPEASTLTANGAAFIAQRYEEAILLIAAAAPNRRDLLAAIKRYGVLSAVSTAAALFAGFILDKPVLAAMTVAVGLYSHYVTARVHLATAAAESAFDSHREGQIAFEKVARGADNVMAMAHYYQSACARVLTSDPPR